MSDGPVDIAAPSPTRKHSSFVGLLKRLVKEKPLGTLGAVITLVLLLTGIFADFLAPYGMNQTGSGPKNRYMTPSYPEPRSS